MGEAIKIHRNYCTVKDMDIWLLYKYLYTNQFSSVSLLLCTVFHLWASLMS
jgi:hypothetical protein